MIYSTVYGDAWDGSTARRCKGDAVLLAMFAYLMTTKHANMIGVFSLPVLYVQHDTGLPATEIERAMGHFEDDGFIVRDRECQDYIFVRRMAEVRLQLADRDSPLSQKDNRISKAQWLYRIIPSTTLADAFFAQYGRTLGLRRDMRARTTAHAAALAVDDSAKAKPRGHQAHAWCGPDARPLCVPKFLHDEFRGRLGPNYNDDVLFGHYAEWVKALGDEMLSGDVLTFYREHVQTLADDAAPPRRSRRASAAATPPDTWQRILAYIETKVTRHDFHTWFVTSKMTEESDGQIVVEDIRERIKWITKHHSGVIDEAVAAVAGGAKIVFKARKE